MDVGTLYLLAAFQHRLRGSGIPCAGRGLGVGLCPPQCGRTSGNPGLHQLHHTQPVNKSLRPGIEMALLATTRQPAQTGINSPYEAPEQTEVCHMSGGSLPGIM